MKIAEYYTLDSRNLDDYQSVLIDLFTENHDTASVKNVIERDINGGHICSSEYIIDDELIPT